MDQLSWFLLGFLSYVAVALVVLITSFSLREHDGGYVNAANADIVALFWPGIVIGMAVIVFLYPLDRLHAWIRGR